MRIELLNDNSYNCNLIIIYDKWNVPKQADWDDDLSRSQHLSFIKLDHIVIH